MARGAFISLILGLSWALVACDKVTYGDVLIETPTAVDPVCIERAVQDLGLADSLRRAPERPGAVELQVRRDLASLSILATETPPYTVRMGFAWLGKQAHDVERASLRLLQDVHAAVMSACDIEQPPAKISTKCETRHCDEWVRPDG